MKNRIGNPSPAARRPRTARWSRAATMVLFTGIAAVISYNDGLYLIRFAGADGSVAYLYPLLPDGLILISSIRLYEAAPKRPGWAMAGVIIGVGLTLAMNVGAGVLHNWMYALADACVPVVFFVALEILRGAVRRGRGASDTPPASAATGQPGPAAEAAPEGAPASEPEAEPDGTESGAPALSPSEAALLALIGTGSQRDIAAMLGVSKTTVGRWKARLTAPVQGAPEETPAEPGETTEEYWAEPPAVRYAAPFEAVPPLRRIGEPDPEPSPNGDGPHA